MTTEEKAKAYDEALEKAKKYHEEYWQVDAKDITETLFPQLIESKDESMMKNIRLALLSVEDAFWRTHGLTAKEAISYIEKQKDFAADEYWRGFKNGRDEVIESPGAFNLQEKQKEQKPAWSEEDEKMIDTIVSVLGQYIDYKAVSGTGTEYATPRYSKEIDWLKSLRPQPKQEWSEEDEKMLWSAINGLNIHIYEKERAWLANKLKSLRPQPSWKPSEEEMKALDVACSGKLWYGEIYLNGLRRIREQLKKL